MPFVAGADDGSGWRTVNQHRTGTPPAIGATTLIRYQ
jgi:hypothetical protein